MPTNKNKPSKAQRAAFKEGDVVDYHSLIGGPVTQAGLRIRAIGTIPSSKEPVFWLEGKAGCVYGEAITPAVSTLTGGPAGPPPYWEISLESNQADRETVLGMHATESGRRALTDFYASIPKAVQGDVTALRIARKVGQEFTFEALFGDKSVFGPRTYEIG